MELHDFAALVGRMRAKQAEYFRTRDRIALQESKDLERRVDAAVNEILGKADRQPELF